MSNPKIPIHPDTRLRLFKKHWICTVKAMSKEFLNVEQLEPVIHNLDQMLFLLIEENKIGDIDIGRPIFKYSINQDVFNTIYECSSNLMGEALEQLKHQQLKLFFGLVSKAHPSVLQCREVLEPLLKLINNYSLRSSLKLELSLVHLLQFICTRLSNEPILQSLCKEIGIAILNDPLPLLNPLVPFLHRDGLLGQQAKSAVLRLVALSCSNEDIAVSVSLQSDFCPVLATGLSALYSALPRKLPSYCHSILLGQINDMVIIKYPALQHFIDYLRFCCHVNEIAHPLVREAVLHYVYNGFLLPVIASSFHQNSMDEVIAATIYYELFLRMITESGLLKAFMCFIIAESYDGYRLVDSILNRLNSNTGLGVATLSLLNTLISFKCEDILFELIFRYLIPCRHLKLTSDSDLCDRDALKDSFDNFIELSLDPYHSDRMIEVELLDTASHCITYCNHVCDRSWQFDYDGANPSRDYLDKVLDPSDLLHQRPFHGFLDHYNQLLEMRDNCNKTTGRESRRSRPSTCSRQSFELDGSCNFTPRCSISRNDSFDTVTSLKSDNDPHLEQCLQRLRYPSAEDLLQQKSHYVLSYNISELTTDEDSIVQSPSTLKYGKGFDLIRTISDDSIESQDAVETVINMDDIRNLATCKEIDEFMANLDAIEINFDSLRNCEVSLDDVMTTILSLEERDVLVSKPRSPDCSYMSLGSGLTMEDNILRNGQLKLNDLQMVNLTAKRTVTVGSFLHTILERLEKFDLNSYQFNIQLTSIVISLLSFPQPLIRNYLLNPREQLTDGVKCLYNVLSAVKSRMDESKIKINIMKRSNHYFTDVCREARLRLERRVEKIARHEVGLEDQSVDDYLIQSNGGDSSFNKNEKRHFNLLEFISRKSNHSERQGNNHKPTKEETEYHAHLNLAFSSVIFEEFCKEIAAYSKEHYVFRR